MEDGLRVLLSCPAYHSERCKLRRRLEPVVVPGRAVVAPGLARGGARGDCAVGSLLRRTFSNAENAGHFGSFLHAARVARVSVTSAALRGLAAKPLQPMPRRAREIDDALANTNLANHGQRNDEPVQNKEATDDLESNHTEADGVWDGVVDVGSEVGQDADSGIGSTAVRAAVSEASEDAKGMNGPSAV